jgi:uncharacterized protein
MAKILKRGDQEQMVSALNFEVKQFGEPEDRTLRFIGSDETPDRDGDVISVAGWDLNNYVKNPVFLWAHDYSIPPVGKANKVFNENGKLMFDIEFPEKGIYPLADLVYNLYKGGFLNATSVGFIGKEAAPREDDAVKDLPEWRRGVKFMAQELLELSAVPVPSNPSALQQAKSAGKLSDDEYSSLMSFIGGEFVVNANTGSKSMSGIKGVYEATKGESNVKEVEVVKDEETKTEGQEPEVKEPTNTEEKSTDGLFSFVVNPKTSKTLLIDNTSGKILGDITEEVKSLISQAVEVAKSQFESEEKAGAVLSKKNKSRLSQAKDLIIEVLGQAEKEDAESGIEEEEKDPAILTDEEELNDPEDVSMNGKKSTDSENGNGEEPENKSAEQDEDDFELELDEEDKEKSIEFDGEDVEDFIKSAVASLIK